MLNSFLAEKNELLQKYDKVLNLDIFPVEKEITKESVGKYKKELENERFVVSFCGQIKAGKSSLINALIFGEEILPKADLVQTAAITILKYSEKPYFEAKFYTEDEWEKLKNYTNEEGENYYEKFLKPQVNNSIKHGIYVRELITKSGKKISEKDLTKLEDFVGVNGKYTPFVKEIILYYPSDILKNIDIVDTPGTNDPNEFRSKITENWIHNSNAVVYVVYAGQSFAKQDMDFINSFLIHVPSKHIIYAVNKVDVITNIDELDEWIETLRNNEALKLRKILSKDSEIVKVSALGALINKIYQKTNSIPEHLSYYAEQLEEKGFIENNGFDLLEKAIEDKLIKNKGQNLLDSHKEIFKSIFVRKERELKIEIEKFKDYLTKLAHSKEELKEEIAEVNEQQEKLNDLIKDFRNELMKKSNNTEDKLRELFSNIKNHILRRVNNTINTSHSIKTMKDDVAFTIRNAWEEQSIDVSINLRKIANNLQDSLKETFDNLKNIINKKDIFSTERIDYLMLNHFNKIQLEINESIFNSIGRENLIQEIIEENTNWFQRFINSEGGREKAKSAIKNKIDTQLTNFFNNIVNNTLDKLDSALAKQAEFIQKEIAEELEKLAIQLNKLSTDETDIKNEVDKTEKKISELETKINKIKEMEDEILWQTSFM